MRPSTCSSRALTENDAENLLLFLDLDRQMLGDGIGQLGVVIDLGDRADDLRRNLLVEFDVVLELGDDGTGHRLDLDEVFFGIGHDFGAGLVELVAIGEFEHARTRNALDQHLHGPVGQFEKLEDGGERADVIKRLGRSDRRRRRSSA